MFDILRELDAFDSFFDDGMHRPYRGYFLNPPYERDRALPARPERPEKPERAGAMKFEVAVGEKDYKIKATAPGFAKEDMNINFEDGVLTITAQKEQKEENKETEDKDGYKVIFSNYNYSKVARSFRVPEGTTTDDIKAKFDNGELVVTIAKKEEPEPKSNKVEIE